MLTQNDIARKLNVSQAMVSRVINAHPYVNGKIRARIAQELERNYVANVNARNLAMRKIGRLGIVIPDAETYQSYFFTKTLQGISDQSRQAGYSIYFVPVGNLSDREIRKDIQGGDYFIVINFYAIKPYLDRLIRILREYRKRYILIKSRVGKIFPCICADNVAGGRMAANYLLELGHRRIAFVSGQKASLESAERRKGYQEAMQAAGLPPGSSWILNENLREGDNLVDFLRQPPPRLRPTAVFASSDTEALNIIYAAAKKGLRIPRDLSIVGFNDFPPLPTLFHPYITTVRQPLYEIGAAAVRRVFDDTGTRPAAQIKLKPRLIERESAIRRE